MLERLMTLEEAIEHCEEVGGRCDACGKEHIQLAGWLKELKHYRDNDPHFNHTDGSDTAERF